LQGQTASASASREQEVEALQMQWKAEVASLQKDLKQAEKKCVTWGGVTVFSPENCLSGGA